MGGYSLFHVVSAFFGKSHSCYGDITALEFSRFEMKGKCTMNVSYSVLAWEWRIDVEAW